MIAWDEYRDKVIGTQNQGVVIKACHEIDALRAEVAALRPLADAALAYKKASDIVIAQNADPLGMTPNYRISDAAKGRLADVASRYAKAVRRPADPVQDRSDTA